VMFTGGFQTMLHSFNIEAVNWVDTHAPLKYTFIASTCAKLEGCTAFDPLAQMQSSNTIDVILPQADVVWVGVMVSDYYFAQTTYWFPLALVVNAADATTLAIAARAMEERKREVLDGRRQRQMLEVHEEVHPGAVMKTMRKSDRAGRSLLQTTRQQELSRTATQLKELIFDPAIGSMKMSRVNQFFDSWGRSYGRYEAEYVIHDAVCNIINEDMKSLKDTILLETMPVLATQRLTSTNVQQFACAMTKLIWSPGELSNHTQQMLTDVMYTQMLTKVYTSSVIRTPANEARLALGNAGHCMFDFVNLMMRHTAIACHSDASPREVFQPRMRSLYSMAYLLGIQLAREQVLGSDAREYLGQYMGLTFQRMRRASQSASRVYDVAGRIEDEDQQVEFEYELMLMDVPGCLPMTNDVVTMTEAFGGNLSQVPQTDMFSNFVLRCGSAVTTEVLNVASIAMFGPMANDDTDFINPLKETARADGLAFGAVVGTSVVHESERYDGASDEYMAMSPAEQAGLARLIGQSNILPLAGALHIRPYILPEEFTEAEYVAGLRHFSPTQQRWVVDGMTPIAPASGRSGLILPGQPYMQYVEERPPSPPPSPPLLSPPPPIPEIVQMPPPILPPPVQQLDMGVISAPITIAVSICAVIMYVFARRRRQLQEIHLDYDDLLEEDEVYEEPPTPKTPATPVDAGRLERKNSKKLSFKAPGEIQE